tara:strand:+ start:2246 stop:2473 length:228 start_codon:yes stop_codon:yes gene_type:complete
MTKSLKNRFEEDIQEEVIDKDSIQKFYFSKEEKEHLSRLRRKIKNKSVKYTIDDIITFKDRPQYVILKNMYPKIK